ncbi:phosphohistidine phosphatase SixA [Saccharospirillum impatiens]|uniref:phosphohistidine phosphatase SixA n=1 Tax=Saccharospirillum impatiens TaxID=169438 RepID=UPI00040C3E95|nr:phosphohistidine phosphatase SixA [Saccharospirillum impatiens]
MILYLLRHGEAEPYGRAVDDASRALVTSGRQAVSRVATELSPVEAVYCSPYLRARQTADLVLSASGQATYQLNQGLTPDSSVAALLSWLDTLTEQSVLLVAHNPLLSSLASQLTGMPGGVALGTATLVCLDVSDFTPGGTSLLWLK